MNQTSNHTHELKLVTMDENDKPKPLHHLPMRIRLLAFSEDAGKQVHLMQRLKIGSYFIQLLIMFWSCQDPVPPEPYPDTDLPLEKTDAFP